MNRPLLGAPLKTVRILKCILGNFHITTNSQRMSCNSEAKGTKRHLFQLGIAASNGRLIGHVRNQIRVPDGISARGSAGADMVNDKSIQN